MIVNGIVVPERQLTPSSPAPITAITPIASTSNQQDTRPTSDERVLISQTLQQAGYVNQRAERVEEQTQRSVSESALQTPDSQGVDERRTEQDLQNTDPEQRNVVQPAPAEPPSNEVERRAQVIIDRARQIEQQSSSESAQDIDTDDVEEQALSIEVASPQAVEEFEQIQTLNAENQADLARIERAEQQRLAALRLAAETLAEQQVEEQLLSTEQADQDTSALDVVQQEYVEEVERAAQLQQNLQPGYQRLGNLIDEVS